MSSRWRHWYRRALPAYWIFLFCVTHFPRLSFGPEAPHWIDKVAHVAAYGLLAFLFWRFGQTFATPPSQWLVWKTGVTLAVYAALDETLQEFVKRNADLADWLCDAAGIAAVLGLLEWRRRRTATTAAALLDSARADS